MVLKDKGLIMYCLRSNIPRTEKSSVNRLLVNPFVPKIPLSVSRWICSSAFLLLCVSVLANLAEATSNDIHPKSSSLIGSANDQLKRFWGISDNTAVVGMVFNYTISNDAFTGEVKEFVITEAGESSLPSWLTFNQETRTFHGLPLEKDIGQYYISVKAHGENSRSKSVAKDVFSIDVVEDVSDGSSSYSTQSQRCASGDILTIVSIILDSNLEDFSPIKRINLLTQAATLMKLPVDILKLKALSSTSKMFDNSALMAGPGNIKKPKTNGAVLQWQVGCSGVINVDQKDRLADIEKLSKNGVFAEELNVPIIGWHVTNQQPQIPKREKRQANQIAGTPVPGVFPTKWPTLTERIDEETSEDNYTPESRIVPTMVSPIFSQSSHHHRHHHGEGPGPYDGRDHGRPLESSHITASPVVRMRFPVTPAASPMATPILVPERPSLYVPLSSIEITGPSRPYPEEFTPIDGYITHMVTSPLPTSDSISLIKPTKVVVPFEPSLKPDVVKNFKPTIDNRMKKLSITAGKVWSYQIPSDTFADFEDGDTRSLKLLFMTDDRTSVSSSSWIQFEPEKQILYALPLEEDIGKYEFILEAMDSEGATTQDHLDVHVRQHPAHRAVHHIFTLGLKFHKWKFPVNIDWEIEVVKKLGKLYGDRNASHITVRGITLDPLRISWTNDSLPKHPCPKEGIEKLGSKLMKEESSEPTHQLSKIVGREIKIEEVSVTFMGVCQPAGSTTQPTRSNSEPILRNPIEQINTTVGEILRFKVPEDTFFDAEDGGTRYLSLVFLTIDSGKPPKSSWVQLDPKSQELYGLPFEGDVGQHEFIMAAMDSAGHSVTDAFIVVVHPRVMRKSSVEFSLHLDADYNKFSRNMSQKVLVAWKLSKLFGDPDPRYITINSVTKGSVVYSWTNNSLPHDPCPKEKIRTLVSYLFNDNETISSKLVEAMQPEFKIIKVDAMPLSICLGEMTQTTGTVIPTVAPAPEDKEPTPTSDDDIYITTIIPAVVIAIMLIIAAMVACFLYRKKRKGKMRMNDNGTFVTKGIPIIFADELDEKSDPAKPPIILKEEKPPLAPIDYPRSVSASSRDSTPQIDRKEVSNMRDTNADLHHPDAHFSPYQPPPPFTSRDSKNSRPKATPTYRQPPPYVPP